MTVFEMSLGGSVMIAVILLLRRLLLYRMPKWTFLLLWGVALCRLLIPFSIPSPLSVYTGADRAIQAIQRMEEAPAPAAGVPQPSGVPAAPAAPAPAAERPLSASAICWTGTALCALCFAVQCGRSWRRFRRAVPAEQEAVTRWQAEHAVPVPIQVRVSGAVRAPLAYGLFRPVILLPENAGWTDERQLIYVLTHEAVHIRRGDLLWKLLLAGGLCLHWFNPLVWAMYFCANRDLELACDEAVVRILGLDSRRGYAHALLTAEEARFSPLCTTYSAKNHLEERIRAIMKMKKQTLAALLAGVLLVAAVAAVFATSRMSGGKDWKRAQVWVDYLNDPEEIPWEELASAAYRELELSEFPGVTFVWNGVEVKARTGEEEMLLLFGMPVYNVFLCDLTGDGLPEFCATAAFGSGIVDNHIMVCDYAAAVEHPKPEPQEGELYVGEAQYFLWDREEYDYALSLEKGRLVVTKSEYRGEVISTGTLAIGGEGQLVMAEERPAAGSVAGEPWDYSVVSPGDGNAGASGQVQPISKDREPSALVPDQVDGIWMNVEKSSVSPHGLLYLIHNETGEELMMGEHYFLQAEDGGQWYDVEAKEGGEIYFIDLAWVLDGRERQVQFFRVKWDDWYGPLPAGHYRVVTQVRHGAERTELTLTAEFDIEG